MYILGLIGAKRCGKSSLAEYLAQHHGFIRVRMADGLKDMLYAMGLTYEDIEGDRKEVPNDLLCGKTPRVAMQTLGTEWGREIIGQDVWVAGVQQEIQQHVLRNPNARIVVEDIRFPNEALMVLRMGGKLWRIRRPVVEPRLSLWQAIPLCLGMPMGEHASEQYWRTLPHHVDIANDTDVDTFIRHAISNLPRDIYDAV